MVPMWDAAAHTGLIDRATLRLHLWPGRGSLPFYEDDGVSQAYTRDLAGYRVTPFSLHVERNRMFVHWEAASGEYRDARRRWAFVLHGWPGVKATLDGQAVPLRPQAGNLTVAVKDDGEKHTLVITK